MHIPSYGRTHKTQTLDMRSKESHNGVEDEHAECCMLHVSAYLEGEVDHVAYCVYGHMNNSMHRVPAHSYILAHTF